MSCVYIIMKIMNFVRNRATYSVFFLVSLPLLSVVTKAHVEDYLVQNGTGTIANFFERNAALECKYESPRPVCRLVATADSIATFEPVSNFRGVIHYDGVFIMAQAVGFSGEMAYWLAAFSQAVDFNQFKGLDSCGVPLPNQYWTPPLKGYLRTSVVTGGTLTHLGIPFGLKKPYRDYTALKPDFNNFDYEGSLSTFRLWARGETDLACTGGFRKPTEDNNFFLGDECLIMDSTLATTYVSPLVSGTIPLAGGPMQFGPQIIDYDCVPSCDDPDFTITNPVYASDFANYINETSATKGYNTLDDGSPVPEGIARMGVYMHLLADRTSHYYCTDVGGRSAVFETVNGTFDTTLSTVKCNGVIHASQHSWEQGVEEPLAPQSYAALELFYQELLSYRELVQIHYPQWFVRQPVAYDTMVGTEDNPGLLDSAFIVRDAQDRYNQMLAVLDSFGFDRPPGFDEGSTAKCKFPEKFAKIKNPNGLLSTSATRLAIQDCTGVNATFVVALTGEQYSERYGKKGKEDTLYVAFTPNVKTKISDVKHCEDYLCRYKNISEQKVDCRACMLRNEPCSKNKDCCKKGKCVDKDNSGVFTCQPGKGMGMGMKKGKSPKHKKDPKTAKRRLRGVNTLRD